jgi:hypothetical protein
VLAQRLDQRAPGYPPGEDAGSSSAHAERSAAANTGAQAESSAHDAPLSTAKSDPAAASPTGGQSERITKAGQADDAGKEK